MSITFAVTKVKELMTPSPVIISPSATLQQAAKKMGEVGCGVLPVGTKDKLSGIITDRDIVIRAIASGKDPAHEKVSDYMTKEVHACNEIDTLEDAAEKMHRHKVSRLIVSDKEGKTTGILSFGCILRTDATPHELASVVKHAAGPVSV
jgi:CBS domain-containing protein